VRYRERTARKWTGFQRHKFQSITEGCRQRVTLETVRSNGREATDFCDRASKV